MQLYNWANIPRFVAQQHIGKVTMVALTHPTGLPDFPLLAVARKKVAGKLGGRARRRSGTMSESRMGVGIVTNYRDGRQGRAGASPAGQD